MFKNFEKILKEELRKQNEKIKKLEAERQMLQNHAIELRRLNLNMQQNLDDVEQCERRLCLRINGVSLRNNESASSTLDDVKTMFEKAGIDVPDGLVDRAN